MFKCKCGCIYFNMCGTVFIPEDSYGMGFGISAYLVQCISCETVYNSNGHIVNIDKVTKE